MGGLGLLFYIFTGHISVLVGIAFAGAFIIVWARGISAKKEIPKQIDILKSLDAYKVDIKQQKQKRTFSAKVQKESLKLGTFEMVLFYKDGGSAL